MNSNDEARDVLQENPITSAVPVREVRVALSMVGGSSLAIYENGVAQEFFRMVHGQGIYGVLKRLTHSHAYVDILSGTSAGGINTILLSTALTVDTNFLATRETWIKLGNVDALMQDPKAGGVGALFRGNTYYLEQIKRTFDFLSDPDQGLNWQAEGERCGVPSGRDAATRHYGDLDLFVTGTHFRAQPQTFFDARTQPIFNNNYAGIFHLKHRARRNESHFHAAMKDCATPPPRSPAPNEGEPWPGAEPFSAQRSDGVRDRLAWVARTTSSLPVVFETANVNRTLMNGIIELPGATRNNYMGDGGYLNKRPLNLVLKAIAERPAHQEVVRKIFFVEPRPEELLLSKSGEPEAPDAWQHAQFARNVPDWQNLSGSLEELYAHNKKVRRVNEALETARTALWQSIESPGLKGPGQAVSIPQRQLWLNIRLQELRDQLIEIWSRALGLDGFEGVSTADEPLAAHQRQRREAEPLRELRSQLLSLLEKHCRELQQLQPASSDSAVAQAAQRESSFSLQEIDTEYFKRKVVRAIEEGYRALYPVADSSEICNRKSVENSANGTLGEAVTQSVFASFSTGYIDKNDAENGAARLAWQRVGNRLRELYHLLDLIEIINENLIAVIGSVVQSSEYLRAAATVVNPDSTCQDIAQDVQELWNLLVSVSRYLLQPIENWPRRFVEEACDRESEGQRRQREQSNAQRLRTELEKRADLICGTLKQSGQQSYNTKAQWQNQVKRTENDERKAEPSEDSLPTLITEQIDNIINDLIFHSAVDMQSILRVRAAAENLSTENRAEKVAASVATTSRAAAWICKLVEGKSDSYQTKMVIAMNFEFLDAALYPLERAAELSCRTYLELVQISTRDVQIGLSDKPVTDKLGGDMLANLSAFLKSSWRANDILWGRLDASGAIAETLLEPARLRRLLDPLRSGTTDPNVAANMMRIVDAYIYSGQVCDADLSQTSTSPAPDDAIGRHLRPIYQKQRDAIESWLHSQASGEGAQANTTGFRSLSSCLLSRHQLEILMQEVPIVVAEAMAEHAQWQGSGNAASFPHLSSPNRVASSQVVTEEPVGEEKVAQPSNSQAEMTVTARDAVENLSRINGYAPDAPNLEMSRRAAREWATNLFSTAENRPDPKKIVDYFRRDYAVGSESIQDIPPLVSLRRSLALCLIALHLTSNSLPPQFKSSRVGQKLMQILISPLSLLVGALYGFVTVLEQGSAAAAAMHAVLWTIVTAVLVCLLVGIHLPPLFIVVAVIAVAVEILIWQLRKSESSS